jgi:hypothetical protein
VRLLDEARREDADIRGVALQALMWDVEVPAESIDVKVENGWITLIVGAGIGAMCAARAVAPGRPRAGGA